jgi:hypothetical protein
LTQISIQHGEAEHTSNLGDRGQRTIKQVYQDTEQILDARPCTTSLRKCDTSQNIITEIRTKKTITERELVRHD